MTKYVKDYWEDSKGVAVIMSNGIWSLWYYFPWLEFENGGSLSRGFTTRNRVTLSYVGWKPDKQGILDASKEAIQLLRPHIEEYFAALENATTTENENDENENPL